MGADLVDSRFNNILPAKLGIGWFSASTKDLQGEKLGGSLYPCHLKQNPLPNMRERVICYFCREVYLRRERLMMLSVPMNPKIVPSSWAVYEKKFKKYVDGMICITISTGRIQPASSSPKAISKIFAGVRRSSIIYTTSRRRRVPLRGRTPADFPHRRCPA